MPQSQFLDSADSDCHRVRVHFAVLSIASDWPNPPGAEALDHVLTIRTGEDLP